MTISSFIFTAKYEKPNTLRTRGSLVVVGSGIKCAAQFTSEAISHIKNADKVLYCVADPATEVGFDFDTLHYIIFKKRKKEDALNNGDKHLKI